MDLPPLKVQAVLGAPRKQKGREVSLPPKGAYRSALPRIKEAFHSWSSSPSPTNLDNTDLFRMHPRGLELPRDRARGRK